MNEIAALLYIVMLVFAACNIWDAYRFSWRVWREAALWRWCFVLGFLIFGPVSVIVGAVYRLKFRPHLTAGVSGV